MMKLEMEGWATGVRTLKAMQIICILLPVKLIIVLMQCSIEEVLHTFASCSHD